MKVFIMPLPFTSTPCSVRVGKSWHQKMESQISLYLIISFYLWLYEAPPYPSYRPYLPLLVSKLRSY